MGASRYVGRVGGLAVALGVGAAVLGGAGAADASGIGGGGGSLDEWITGRSASA